MIIRMLLIGVPKYTHYTGSTICVTMTIDCAWNNIHSVMIVMNNYIARCSYVTTNRVVLLHVQTTIFALPNSWELLYTADFYQVVTANWSNKAAPRESKP